MILAAMLERSEDSLICDLGRDISYIRDAELQGELYRNVGGWPPWEDSRIMMLFSGNKIRPSLYFKRQASTSFLCLWWAETKDGQKNRNRPESVVGSLLRKRNRPKSRLLYLKSAEDFNKNKGGNDKEDKQWH